MVLGKIGTETIYYEDTNGLLIAYSTTGRQVQVHLICDQTATTPTLALNGKINTLTVCSLTSCRHAAKF